MTDAIKSNLNTYRDEANASSIRLIKRACEYLLVRNKKISPQSTHDVMVEIADDNERRHLIKFTTLRRKNLQWRGIIDEYEIYRLKNPVNKKLIDVDAKFAEQRLSQQNYMLREKVLDLSDKVETLNAALEKTKQQYIQTQTNSSSLVQMAPIGETTDCQRRS